MNRRDFLKALAVGGATMALPRTLLWAGTPAGGAKMNVLFLVVDDLRTQLACYGHKQIISPNIDALASRGLLLERAYCQQAVCAPSRTSVLTGCRPDTTGVHDLETPLSKARPDLVSLPRLFKTAGYETVSLGKVYHHANDDPAAWSAAPWRPRGQWIGRGYLSPETQALCRRLAEQAGGRPDRGPAFEAADVPDNAYFDGLLADRAVEELRRLKDRPFFLAVGFIKPHLPFCAPRKYWDLYKRADMPLSDQKDWPDGMPPLAGSNWGELRFFAGIPDKGKLTDEQARELIHGYYACVSYTDAQIGRVVGELDRLGLRDKTVIVLWGDHGWKLGEYSAWCKHTNFELDTHAPLILQAPGHKAGLRSSRLVEFVDIYPTLAELCGLTAPASCEGTSMAPLLRQPDRAWKAAAFSQYPRGAIMGYSMRTDRWRYTEWVDRKTKAVTARELYDHRSGEVARVNLADRVENARTVGDLSAMLTAGGRAARP